MVPTRTVRPVLALAVFAVGCAVDPPTLPGGASVGESSDGTSPLPADPDPMVDDGVATDEGTSGGDDDPDASDDGSSSGDAPVGTDDAATDDTGMDVESTGVGVESTGAELPWYAGHYEGSWDGDCSGPIPLSGSGSWSVDVDAEGAIVGEYHGDFDGEIEGWVDDQGNTEATATGPELGECNWDGLIEGSGDAHGDLDCPLDCSGNWSGEKS
jgi:hypothetical protein